MGVGFAGSVDGIKLPESGDAVALEAAGPTRIAEGASTMPSVRTAFGSPVSDDACSSSGSGSGVAPAESVVVAVSGWFVGFGIGGHDPSTVLVAAAGLKPFPVSDTDGRDAQPLSTTPATLIAITMWTTGWRRSSRCRRRPFRIVRMPRSVAAGVQY